MQQPEFSKQMNMARYNQIALTSAEHCISFEIKTATVTAALGMFGSATSSTTALLLATTDCWGSVANSSTFTWM